MAMLAMLGMIGLASAQTCNTTLERNLQRSCNYGAQTNLKRGAFLTRLTWFTYAPSSATV